MVKKDNGQFHSIQFKQCILILSVIFVNLLFVLPACAMTKVSIYPSTLDIDPNSSFEIVVNIDPDNAIVGAQADIYYSNELIRIDRVRKGDLYDRSDVMHLFNVGTIDNAVGSVTNSYAVAFGGNPITTPGSFLVMECTALDKTAYCPLYLTNVILSDSQGQTVPVSVVDGGFFIGRPPENMSEPIGNTPVSNPPAGGGGGGGGAESGEDTANIYLKATETALVLSDSSINYRFRDPENPVDGIEFFSLKNAGNIPVTIEVLNDISSFVDSKPPGLVYRNMNIWVGKAGYASGQNMRDMQVNFKVSREWMEKNDVAEGSIRLNRFNSGRWDILETSKTGDDGVSVLFMSSTPGFSPFSITAIGKPISADEVVGSGTNDVTGPLPGAQVQQDIQDNKKLGHDPSTSIVPILAAFMFLSRKYRI